MQWGQALPVSANTRNWQKTQTETRVREAWYLFSGSGCRAATTPPRAAAERLRHTARIAGSLRAAARGATRRSATSSTTLSRYHAPVPLERYRFCFAKGPDSIGQGSGQQ